MKTKQSSKDNRRRLAEIAADQQGFFTSQQAVEVGYASSNHDRLVKAGDWDRVARGIFRLTLLGPADRPDLVTVSLWSRGRDGQPKGVISHASALSLWELGDVNPDMVDLTMPVGHLHETTPPYPTRIHEADLRESDVEYRQGYRVTRPLTSVVALLVAGETQTHQLREALREGIQRGLISADDIESQPMSDDHRELLRSWRV